MKDSVCQILATEKCSLVVRQGDTVRTFHARGVEDLHRLLTFEPELLQGAVVADKVVGKGAAALMAKGEIAKLYAPIASRAAIALLDKERVSYEVGEVVEHIINRRGDDICPVERLCATCTTADECLPLIDNFLKNK